MSAIDQLFKNLRDEGRKAFMPFITAGDPDLGFTKAVIQKLARSGSSLCEIGIPYSDPVADGPVIQASYTRALDNHVKLAAILDTLRDVSATVRMPLVTMVSYATVYRHGLANYVTAAKRAGTSGAIIPDLLAEEATEMAAIARDEDFSLIQLVTPTTPRDRALRIAETSTGFLYYVSVAGITGERTELPAELTDSVGWLRERTELPICIGFGISLPEHVKKLAAVADGLIVGSAIVRLMAKADARGREKTLEEIGRFVGEMIDALNTSKHV